MGMGSFNENRGHQAAVLIAESIRQGVNGSQVNLKAAEITFYRAARASAIANGVSPAPFISALMELGTGGA